MAGTAYENKGRSMRHRAIIVESRTKGSEGNYTSSDKTVMSLMQNSNCLARNLVMTFRFFLIHKTYDSY